MTDFNDQYYIEKIARGDFRAFEVLVNQYKKMAFSIALRITQNSESAEEVAQDSFVKIFKSIDKFKGEAKFSTWLYRITYNTSLDYIKKNKNAEPHYSIDELTINIVDKTKNALDHLEQEESKELIKKCLNKLKEEDQLILTLYYFEELSLQEIAIIVNKNYNQVKINLYRGRKKLAIVLSKYLAPEIVKNYGG